MVTPVRRIPSPPLLEPGAPQWAVRFAARLNEFFRLRHAQAPEELWISAPADFPPAALWRGALIYGTSGTVYVSDGTSWIAVGPGAAGVPEAPNDGQFYSRRNLAWAVPPAPSTIATPPQFDNDTSIANTAFVQRALGNFAGYLLPPGNVTLTLADLGKFVAANSALTLTLPAISTVPAGNGFHVQANALVTLNAGAGNNVFKPTAGLAASQTIVATKSALVVSDGGATWVMSGWGA